MNDPKDIEALADVEHNSWSKWTSWMLARLEEELSERHSAFPFIVGDSLGSAQVPRVLDGLPCVQWWRRQMVTTYADLSDKEKESDREVVREKLVAYRGPTQLLRASVEILVWDPTVSPTDGPKLLTVTNRRFGGFSCPGGKVEAGESFISAARRELQEETGCEAISIEPFIGGIHWDDPQDHGFPWFAMAYFADIGKQVPTKQEEGTEIGWHTTTQLVRDSIYPEWYRYLFGQMG